MLIPIGFFGAGGAAGAYELISTAYGTGSSGTISFTSIPSTYKHLQIRYLGNKASSSDLRLTANSIASGYSAHYLQGDGSAVSSGAFTSQTTLIMQNSVGGSTANSFAAGIIDILDYASTAKNKTVRAFTGQTGTFNFVDLHSGMIPTTSALTTISLAISSGSWTTTSRFSLYGIKG